MKNAHLRFGWLTYFKRTEKTTTTFRLRMDRFIGEVEPDPPRQARAHFVSRTVGTNRLTEFFQSKPTASRTLPRYQPDDEVVFCDPRVVMRLCSFVHSGQGKPIFALHPALNLEPLAQRNRRVYSRDLRAGCPAVG